MSTKNTNKGTNKGTAAVQSPANEGEKPVSEVKATEASDEKGAIYRHKALLNLARFVNGGDFDAAMTLTLTLSNGKSTTFDVEPSESGSKRLPATSEQRVILAALGRLFAREGGGLDFDKRVPHDLAHMVVQAMGAPAGTTKADVLQAIKAAESVYTQFRGTGQGTEDGPIGIRKDTSIPKGETSDASEVKAA